jgi:hypothetical protein
VPQGIVGQRQKVLQQREEMAKEAAEAEQSVEPADPELMPQIDARNGPLESESGSAVARQVFTVGLGLAVATVVVIGAGFVLLHRHRPA